MGDFWDFLLFSSLFNRAKQNDREHTSLYMTDLWEEEDKEDEEDNEYEEEWEDY